MDPMDPSDDSFPLADKRCLSWAEYGDPTGYPVIYCHATPGSRLEPSQAHDHATNRGLRLIAPDRPGYGTSSPAGERSLSHTARDLAALADHLDLRHFSLLGFSGGAPVALALASARPERIGQVVLASPLGPLDQVGTEGMGEAYRHLWDLARTDFPTFARELEQGLVAYGSAADLFLAAAPRPDRVLLADPEINSAFRANLAEAHRQGLTGLFEDAGALARPWSFHPTGIRCPVRLFHGTQDPNAPPVMSRWLADHLPDAKRTEWPGAGHFALLVRWEEVLGPWA
jgi:pimeloyl-ACP methyl ester carboxylesterase